MSVQEIYNTLTRPTFVDNIKKIGIDVVFEKAKGNYLFYDNNKKIFDFIGGYGTCILGHNNDRLINYAKLLLEEDVAFQAQRSIRKNAALLSEKLNKIMLERTGNEYVSQFGNTGAEANEIAIRHAFYEKRMLDDTYLQNMQQARDFIEKSSHALSREQKEAINEKIRHNDAVLEQAKRFICMVDGFHGKTSATLKLSHAKAIRYMVENLDIITDFVEPNDIDDLNRQHEQHKASLYWFTIQNGQCSVTERLYTPIIAYFLEPILGDGGIIEINQEFAHAVRDICDTYSIPMIYDEIQCGMGRTGKFLASEHTGVFADYYCFSKALGGGISKVSVCVISKKRFINSFALLHSSTFNEDDYACGIACEVLDCLFENDGEAIRNCAVQGEKIIEKLVAVKQKYPKFIKEIRGKGLMLGIVIDNNINEELRDYSTINYINLVEGYLFKHGFRVGTTLTSGAVLRLEPSAYITDEEICRLGNVLNDVGALIQQGNYRAFVEDVTAGK